MSINNSQYNFFNTSALDAVQKLPESSVLTSIRELQSAAALKLETMGAFASAKELQSIHTI